MQLNGIVQQRMDEKSVNQITEQGRDAFQKTVGKFVAVVNSCKTFSTGCSTQKDHNIMKACGALLAKTLVKPECYTSGLIDICANKINIILPRNTESVSAKADNSAAASIGKLSDLKTSDCSAQELFDMLSKQLYKPETSQEMRENIQTVLNMVNTGLSSKYVMGSEYAGSVERSIDQIKNTFIEDILKQDRINEKDDGPVLEMTEVIQLELMKDISFHSLNNY